MLKILFKITLVKLANFVEDYAFFRKYTEYNKIKLFDLCKRYLKAEVQII